jgi:hypothetical protein
MTFITRIRIQEKGNQEKALKLYDPQKMTTGTRHRHLGPQGPAEKHDAKRASPSRSVVLGPAAPSSRQSRLAAQLPRLTAATAHSCLPALSACMRAHAYSHAHEGDLPFREAVAS